jgi:4-hydroxy-tetrahydrodipicolinate synthase
MIPSQHKRIRGVLAPVVTPFKADLSPDRERFIAQCRWLVSQNCGLAPFGTTSEANSMSKDERMWLLDALVTARIDRSRMMPGTGCSSITETVELTAHAVKHGCAGVLMLPPFYYKGVTEEGLYRYFSDVVQRVGEASLRIYLYHIPPVAMVGITPKLVERLLKAYPSAIAGMKDSSGDWNNTKNFLDAFAGEHFDVFVGSETFLLANMRNGGAGTISATANVNPAAIDALYQSAKSQGPNPRPQANSKRQSLKTNPLRQRTLQHQHTADSADRQQSKLENRKSAGAAVASAGAAVASAAAAVASPGAAVASAVSADKDLAAQQAQLNVVREIFSSQKFPSIIAAIKQAIAIYANDAEWARVRPPLVELTSEQSRSLAAQLQAIGFTIEGIKRGNLEVLNPGTQDGSRMSQAKPGLSTKKF